MCYVNDKLYPITVNFAKLVSTKPLENYLSGSLSNLIVSIHFSGVLTRMIKKISYHLIYMLFPIASSEPPQSTRHSKSSGPRTNRSKAGNCSEVGEVQNKRLSGAATLFVDGGSEEIKKEMAEDFA